MLFYSQTSFTPDKIEYGRSKAQLLAQLDVSMGGRVAEELQFGKDQVRWSTVYAIRRCYLYLNTGYFQFCVCSNVCVSRIMPVGNLSQICIVLVTISGHQVTTGASSDFNSATNIAKGMVMQYGMCDATGVRTYDDDESAKNKLLGAEIDRLLNVSVFSIHNFIDQISCPLLLFASFWYHSTYMQHTLVYVNCARFGNAGVICTRQEGVDDSPL